MVQRHFVPAPPLVGIHPNPGPGRGKKLDEETKWRAVILWKDKKLSPYAIGKKLKIRKESAANIIEKYQETKSVKDRPRSGRKRKLSASQRKEVVRMAKRKKTAPQISRALDNKVVDRTIQRTLKEEGFFYGKIKKIEKLTKAQKAHRVEYCKEMKGYNWNTVLFSDEKTFQLGAGPDYAWQKPGNRLTREVVNHAPKLHVWGAIGAHVKAKLYFFQENLNSELYRTILGKKLAEKALTYSNKCPKHLVGNWQFLQDNSAVHKAKKSMKFLSELVGNRIIDHPAKSPDLNPMEDMWSYLDWKVKNAKITTIRALKIVLQREWNDLPCTKIRKSVDSMERRTKECRDSGGNRLPY